MATDTQAETDTQPARKWTSLAGPRQSKTVEQAITALRWRGKEYIEITDHGTMGYNSPFSAPSDASVKAEAEIAARFNYIITRENFKEVADAFNEAARTLPIPEIDKRTTPEQRAAAQRAAEEGMKQREAKTAAHKIEYDKHVAELRAKYPWAKADDRKLSTYARAAANLRKELALEFPGVRFSVTSEGFSMGNAIRVDWTDGPSSKDVKAISGKYEQGSFDGMTDSYNYDHSPHSDAVSLVLGQAKYVTESRSHSPEVEDGICNALCMIQGVANRGRDTQHIFGTGDQRRLSEHFHILMSKTSLPGGAKVTGIERDDDDGQMPFRVTFESPTCPLAAEMLAGSCSIQKHFHTKRNVDFFLVVLNDHVGEDEFNRLRNSCKQAGGWYSRKWGSTPGGFAFDSQADATTWAAVEFAGATKV